MVLIVEDGTGKADAQAYGSVAEADAYLASVGRDGDATNPWTGFSEPKKEEFLLNGTVYLDDEYRAILDGSKRTKEQALQFPRVNVALDGGFTLDSDEIPTKLKNADFESALLFSLGVDPHADVTDFGNLSKKRIVIGPLTIDKSWSPPAAAQTVRQRIRKLMADFVVNQDKVIRA
jgi:hypothetical protein